RALALRRVPSSQRAAMIGARARLAEAEFLNLFRYQVARSRPWQQWFEAIGVDWWVSGQVEHNLPDRSLLDIAGLLEAGAGGGAA
ncbi:MAG: hypothetical protein KC457_26410, partial [Myxococcales bacterium]|nr:hypothetical protein [Myxococcales bacterium]